MSTNHYSSPEAAQWWPQQHHQQQEPDTTMEPLRVQPISAIPVRTWHPDQLQPQPQPTWFNVGGGDQLQPQPQPQQQPLFHDNNQQEQVGDDMKEHMFEKILTPSDVGRLNRLVIPKNHAEEHLPAGAEGYSSEHGKGLLLNFEDESGKCWRFRYSYWSSSQSYVLTKGWTRFVKEKHLEAGDIVVFQRHRMDHNHFFVSWRRRLPGAPPPGRPRRRRVEEAGTASGSGDHSHGNNNNNNNNSSGYSHGNSENVGVGVGWRREYYPALLPYPTQHQHLSQSPDFLPPAGGGSQGPNETTPVVRLFGVNLLQ